MVARKKLHFYVSISLCIIWSDKVVTIGNYVSKGELFPSCTALTHVRSHGTLCDFSSFKSNYPQSVSCTLAESKMFCSEGNRFTFFLRPVLKKKKGLSLSEEKRIHRQVDGGIEK